MTMKTVLLAAVSIILCGASQAHDFWIEPGTFRPAVGEHVALSLRVGDPFEGSSVTRRANHLKRFFLAGAAETPVSGRWGAEPAGLARPITPGLGIVAYESHANGHRMSLERFRAYLEHAGLERVTVLGPTTRAPVRERFTRCARTLIDVDRSGAGRDHPVGLPLELVAETNPYAPGASGGMDLRLLFRGEPLAGALVVATPAHARDKPIHARTGGDGRVSLKIDSPGPWLVTTVHMIESESAEADWDSYWASLTFELIQEPASSAAAATMPASDGRTWSAAGPSGM